MRRPTSKSKETDTRMKSKTILTNVALGAFISALSLSPAAAADRGACRAPRQIHRSLK